MFTSGNLDTIWIVDRLEAIIAGLKSESEHYQRREDSIFMGNQALGNGYKTTTSKSPDIPVLLLLDGTATEEREDR